MAGGSNMRNHEVIFDRVHRRVAFVPSDCGKMHDGKLESKLKGSPAPGSYQPSNVPLPACLLCPCLRRW